MSDFFAKLPKNESAALEPASDEPASGAVSDSGDAELRRYEKQLLDIVGVEGLALRADGLVVYVNNEHTASRLPESLDGKSIHPVVTGEICAQTTA